MANYKRPAVVFNLDNPNQKELYDWVMEQSNNFSDFTRTLLFHYKQTKTSNITPVALVDLPNDKPISQSDASAMSDLL